MQSFMLSHMLVGAFSLLAYQVHGTPTAGRPWTIRDRGSPRDTYSSALESTTLKVHTNQGIIQGTHLNNEVSAFLGVPYAQPPVGDLRFRPPMPLTSADKTNTTVLDASKFGAVCWQFHYRSVLLDNLVETTPQSEDCLTLNIFIPRRPANANTENKSFSTLMWIYGGSFSEGGGSIPGLASNVLSMVSI